MNKNLILLLYIVPHVALISSLALNEMLIGQMDQYWKNGSKKIPFGPCLSHDIWASFRAQLFKTYPFPPLDV